MNDIRMEHNQVAVTGEVVSDFAFSHRVYGEGFYTLKVAVSRYSNFVDILPLMVSERLIDTNRRYIGQTVKVNGQFRSYNRHEEDKSHLLLSVFVRDMEFVDKTEGRRDGNQIFLDGFVCKQPVYRKTPLGREIADLLIAVNRPYGKADYIPCICWGRDARYASGFKVGGHVKANGRIQSREYMKKVSESETQRRTAYEASIHKIECLG